MLFIVAAVTDYFDGMLARSRKQVTDLGRLLDPLADKLLLVGDVHPDVRADGAARRARRASARDDCRSSRRSATSGSPWWIVAIVLGRELFMTIFRQAAARRGVVIAAIGPAKWKTGVPVVWVGCAYFWFFAATLAARSGWSTTRLARLRDFNGIVGTLTMIGAVVLTLYSLVLYLRSFGSVFATASAAK